jgi:site-specific DNA recombinase
MECADRNSWKILESFGGTYESAKSDGRKEFQRMLDFIKKYKGKVSRILVYSVDRFSRTGGAAIKLAQDLREKYGVIVYAVTQPSDTTNSSGVLHQNIQLLFSEYDNQLRKEKAVAGMKHKFQQGIWATRVPRPFYCGIINHGLLDGKVVESTHEKLISQEIFLKANGIHQANPNYGVPHKTENDYLPLKVFVKRDQCGHPFTGYIRTKITKKEKKELVFYYYKCRTNGCKCNRNNKELHQLFQEFLSQYSIKEEFVSAIQYELEHLFHDLNMDNTEQEVLLKGQLTEVKKKLSTILEKYHVLETITQEVFDSFYQKYTEEKDSIEKGLEACSGALSISNLPDFLENAISLSRKLNTVWISGDIQLKEDLQKLIFPEGVYYDRKTQSFRTEKVHFIFELIASSSGTPPEKKKGTSYLIDYLSLSAEREGFEPPDL